MNSVDTLRRSVKRIIDSESEIVTMSARLSDTPPPLLSSEPPTITGSSGRMHGARMVSTPAINAMSNRGIENIILLQR